jgi:hypothetical protein
MYPTTIMDDDDVEEEAPVPFEVIVVWPVPTRLADPTTGDSGWKFFAVLVAGDARSSGSSSFFRSSTDDLTSAMIESTI